MIFDFRLPIFELRKTEAFGNPFLVQDRLLRFFFSNRQSKIGNRKFTSILSLFLRGFCLCQFGEPAFGFFVEGGGAAAAADGV